MISFLRIRLLSLLFLLFLAGGVSAQSLDLDQLLTEAEITGMSIAVIEDGRISQLLNAGVRSSETQPPITDETVFEAESLSKSVVAWIALRLIDEGTLDLDQSLAQLSPWEDAAHDSRYEQITTRMVLSHTSGFPNFRVPGEPLPLLFDPGAFYTYSGEGFLFLQHVLEAITYSSLEDLAREYVFEPFGMTSSSFVWPKRLWLTHRGRPYRYGCAAGQICATAGKCGVESSYDCFRLCPIRFRCY